MSVNLTRYAMWFAGASLVALTLVMAVQMVFSVQLGSAFVPIIPAMVAAMVEGSKWAKSSREKLPAPWKDAGAMTGVAIGLTALLILATTPAVLGMGREGIRVVILISGVYAIFWLITNRVFLGMGARNEWAAQDRRGS
ncbi:MAG: ABZJ_00895 family protein [Pseudomonadota bacterium]